MGIFRGLLLVSAYAFCAISIKATTARAANVSGMVEDSDALDSAKKSHSVRPFSLMVSSTFQTPALNNLDSHLNKMEMVPDESGASAVGRHSRRASSGENTSESTNRRGSGGQRQPGYMLRHSVAASYEFSPGMILGPVLNFSEPFSGRREGQFLVDDPQLRFTILDVMNKKIGDNHLRSSMLISASLPVSDSSRRRSSRGALSVAGSPKMHFRGTPYSVGATCSLKTSLYGRDTGGALISSRLMGGIQGGYRVSRQLESNLLFHSSTQFGPEAPSGDWDGPMRDRGAHSFGLMPSLKFQATPYLSFAPRLDWFLDQPINTTTVSVAAMMRLI